MKNETRVPSSILKATKFGNVCSTHLCLYLAFPLSSPIRLLGSGDGPKVGQLDMCNFLGNGELAVFPFATLANRAEAILPSTLVDFALH